MASLFLWLRKTLLKAAPAFKDRDARQSPASGPLQRMHARVADRIALSLAAYKARRNEKMLAALLAWSERALGAPCTQERVKDDRLKPRKTRRIRHAPMGADAPLPGVEPGSVSHIVHWTRDRRCAKAFAALGKHLRQQGLTLPRQICHDPARGFFLMQDLGKKTMGSLPDAALTAEAYLRMVRELARFHSLGGNGLDESWCWEPRYTVPVWHAFCLRRFPSWVRQRYVPLTQAHVARVGEELLRCCYDSRMEEGPYCLNHSDFHVDNCILKDNVLYILDWEHASLRPAALDLANFFVFPFNRAAWRYREKALCVYLEASEATPPGTHALVRHQLPYLEAGFLLRYLPLYARGPLVKDVHPQRMIGLIRRVFAHEALRPYPAFSDLMLDVAGRMEQRLQNSAQ